MLICITNQKNSNYFFSSLQEFTCKNDKDCHAPNGYCHVGECKCLPNYEFELDCSIYGCKCLITKICKINIAPKAFSFKNSLKTFDNNWIE